MSRFAFIAQLKTHHATARNTSRAVLAFMDTTRVRILLIAAVIVFGVLYLWLVNSSASSGFYLTDLEDQVAQLETNYRKLEITRTELQSLEHIQEMSAELEFESTARAAYIDPDRAVAFQE